MIDRRIKNDALEDGDLPRLISFLSLLINLNLVEREYAMWMAIKFKQKG
jgi:hypothetical protein